MIQALKDFVTWVNMNAGILTIMAAILLAVVPAIWSLIRYIRLKNRELQFERFKIYHKLIKDLVQPEASGQAKYLDRQFAIVFEFRHFPDYYDLTYRMLQGLRHQWDTGHPQFTRLLNEIDLTVNYIGNKLKKIQKQGALDEENALKATSLRE